MYRQNETPANRDLYNSARRMYESHKSVVEFKKKDMSDLYGLLGVDRGATQEEIKHAYRQLVLKFHPDRSLIPESGEVMQIVMDAYNTLVDVDRRARYDRSRECRVPFERASGTGLHDVGPFVFYRQRCHVWVPEDEFDVYSFIHSMEDAFSARSLYRRRVHRNTSDALDAGYIKTLLAFLVLVLIVSLLS